METSKSPSKGVLGWIEIVGNKMPHPILLFLYIIFIVVVLSVVLGGMGLSAIDPTSGKTIAVQSLLSPTSINWFMRNFVPNFQKFPVLGIVLVLGIATGVCDKSGFFTNAIKMSLAQSKGNAVVFVVAFVGVIGHSMGDAAFILIPAIAGGIFYGMKRNPLAGIFLGYASVGGGFCTAFIPGGWDVILAPITISAAHTIDPTFDMSLLSGYTILTIGAVIIAIVAAMVNIKIIEPRLGKYDAIVSEENSADVVVTDLEKKAVKKACLAVLIFIVFLAIACIPENSLLRNPQTGSLVFGAPLMNNAQFFIVTMFAIAGATYTITTGRVKSVADANGIMVEAVKTMAPFIVLAVVIGQFIAMFSYSNLANVLAILGGEALVKLPVSTQTILIMFFLLTCFINLFIGSGSVKWFILAPIFVPIFMQLNVHPAFTLVVYRFAGSATLSISPLLAYFAILLTTAQKYDKTAGMGTIFSAMIPYNIIFVITYIVIILLCINFDLPIGPGGQIWLK